MKKRHTNKGFAAVTFCTLLFALAATSVQAQQVFIPDTGETWIDDNPILQQTAIGESDCYYIRKTSFYWRRHILSLQDDRLVYTRVYRDDWESWLLTGYWKPDFHRYEMQLSQSDQSIFSDLMDAATQTAKYYNNRLIGCDGINYCICSNSRRASVWSPEGNSRTRRTIRALDSLCYAAEHNDYAVLRRQLDTCRTLTDEFRQLYQRTCIGDMIKEGGSSDI